MDITLAPLSAIPAGEGRSFEIAGVTIAVFHTRDGQIFAAQGKCPHRGGPLADGLIGAGTVICPLHSWKFDLRTGQSSTAACAIKTYPVRLNSTKHIVVSVEETVVAADYNGV